MDPSENFEKALLLENKVAGMNANSSARIKIMEEEASPVPESAQCDDPKDEYVKQIFEYLARHSVEESTPEANLESYKNQEDKIEELTNARGYKRKVSNDVKKCFEPISRVVKKSLRSCHPPHPDPEDTSGLNAEAAIYLEAGAAIGLNEEAVKAVLDLVFINFEEKKVHKNVSLLSKTRAEAARKLAVQIRARKRNLLNKNRDPNVEIEKATRDLLFLDFLDYWYDPIMETVEGYKASIIEKLGEKRDADVDIEVGCEEDEHGKHARDRVVQDSETTDYEEKSLAVKSHAKETEPLASEIELLDERRDPTADTADEACELNEQSQRERDLAFQGSESKGHEEVHAKKTLDVESRNGHSSDDERGRSVDCDAPYDENELLPAFSNLLTGIQTATNLFAALIESRKSQSSNEKSDPDIDLGAGFEGDELKTVLSDDCKTATSISSDNAAATEGLPIVSTSDEDMVVTSTSDEDAIIVNDELKHGIDCKLTTIFEEDKQLIPASKELLLLYRMLKAIKAKYEKQEASASSPPTPDACQLNAPLQEMQDLQESASKSSSPKVNEKSDLDTDLYAGFEGDELKTVFSDVCESSNSFSSDNAAATEGLLVVPASDEDMMVISNLDEDANIVNDELRDGIDRKLTTIFEEDKQLIPASKELLLLYHILKAFIAEHENQERAASPAHIPDACQLGAPLEAIQDFQEWASKCFSPNYLCACA